MNCHSFSKPSHQVKKSFHFLLFIEKREIFKKERLPAHNVDTESDDEELAREKQRKKTQVKVQRKVAKHSSKHAESKVNFYYDHSLTNTVLLKRNFSFQLAGSVSFKSPSPSLKHSKHIIG